VKGSNCAIKVSKEYITELLEKHQDPPITNQRILELIREEGYQGGKTILGDYMTTIRKKNTKGPVYCVETSLGEMGSHDWSEYYVYFSETGEKQKVIFFSFILNYSRRQYIEVAHDKTQLTLFKCLINTFTYFVHIPLKTDTCSVSKRTLFLKIKRTLSQKNIGVKFKKFKNDFLKFFSLIYPGYGKLSISEVKV